MQARPLFIHALTPVHTGTGQSADVIDLPISREKTTGWPQIPGSSIKGVLKDEYRKACGSDDLFVPAFGPETENASEGASMLTFGDGKILCLAVRSFFGTFAWVTCPHIIKRYNRDASVGMGSSLSDVAISNSAEGCKVATESALVATHNGCGGYSGCKVAAESALKKVYLEDLDFAIEAEDQDSLAGAIAEMVFADQTEAWQQEFKKRFCVVSDDMFAFLSETATEVTARIAMDEDLKTVRKGGLWYEEAVPAESIFWSVVVAEPRNGTKPTSLWGFLKAKWPKTIQIGGNATVGRGIVRPVLGGGA